MVNLSLRDKAIICGLFLSKYDKEGLMSLGFSTFTEAFNVLGLAINAKPASIKNYRDELDPLFPNQRQGWHKRRLREHCQKIYEIYANHDLDDLALIVSRITGCSLIPNIDEPSVARMETFAQRLLTGRAAENFFLNNYRLEQEFTASSAIDVTQTGCGYDFRLEHTSIPSFSAVEVKGLKSERGGVSLTNKEYSVAKHLQQSYFLYVVKNFDEVPYAVKYRDPIGSGLGFRRQERKVIQISWSTAV